jgi:hypothetical protein
MRRRGRGWRFLESRRKDFFFEKKKQKTFANAAGVSFYLATSVLTLRDKSFLVLFFKKELLPSL